MKKIVTVTNERLKAEMLFAEMFLGTGVKPSFTGELLAVNPTKEEFATFDSNFAGVVASGQVEEEIVEGVVYFDSGANRAYILDEEWLTISELN